MLIRSIMGACIRGPRGVPITSGAASDARPQVRGAAAGQNGRNAVVAAYSAPGFHRLDPCRVDKEALPLPWDQLASRNRYADVLPTPRTRVPLSCINNDPRTEYINANFIRGLDDKRWDYIAAQGPTKSTIVDFWRMVWEHDLTTIVMLTGLVEGGRPKCEPYWPVSQRERRVKHGDFVVEAQGAERASGYLRSKLLVTYGAQRKEVLHFWYDTWPDHGVPRGSEEITKLIEDVQQSAAGTNSPVLVHCSAGIGRTGTYMTVDMGIQLLAKGETADVLQLVGRMREDRGGLVQTEAQAHFSHQALVQIACRMNAASRRE